MSTTPPTKKRKFEEPSPTEIGRSHEPTNNLASGSINHNALANNSPSIDLSELWNSLESDSLDLATILMDAYAQKEEQEVDAKNTKHDDGTSFSEQQMSLYMTLKSTIFGIGPVTAGKLIRTGCTSVDDLVNDSKKRFKLHYPNKTPLWLKHADDLAQKIPRAEIEAHQKLIDIVIEEEGLQLSTLVAGSYRRGGSECGDIDMIIWSKDDESNLVDQVSVQLRNALEAQGYIGHTLSGRKKKLWIFLVKLPVPGSLWRQLDITIASKEDLPYTMLRKTGSKEVRRGLSLLKLLNNKRAVFEEKYQQTAEDGVHGSSSCLPEQDIFTHQQSSYRAPASRNMDLDATRFVMAKKELDELL